MRYDPTRTTMLRRRFEVEMAQRFQKLKRKLYELVVFEDAFGIRATKKIERSFSVANERWRFMSEEAQIQHFQAWLEAQVIADILGKTLTQVDIDSWLKKYIEEGFRKGMERAFGDVRKPQLAFTEKSMDFFRGTKSEFLRQSFGRPVSVERVKLLLTRTLTDLKGVTDAMSQQIIRELVDGMIRGDSPRTVARNIAKVVDKIGKTRALTIARTETIRAHAQGQLIAFERLGVQKLGVAVEWNTARDGKVCPLCRPLDRVVLTLKEAQNMIPRHPNCRCAFVPANVGEDKRGQKRTAGRITDALEASIRAERPKKSLREARAKSRWSGADLKPAQNRPKGIV